MSAPTKDEVAKARKHAETVAAALDREAESAAETGRMRACLGAESAASSIRTILRGLDAAERERDAERSAERARVRALEEELARAAGMRSRQED